MCKRPAFTSLISLIWLLALPWVALAQSDIKKVHYLDNLLFLKSPQEITNYFAKANVRIDVMRLSIHRERSFFLAAYPYSGPDTIDVYGFIKNGDFWQVKIFFFALHPNNRTLQLRESGKAVSVFDGDKELFQL